MKPAPLSPGLFQQHLKVTRRYFLQMGAAGWAAMQGHALWAKGSDADILADATEDLEYLTVANEFGTVERGKPLPYKLPLAKRLEVGLERKTWRLDVMGDPKSNAQLGNPLSRAAGNAFDFPALMKLAERHSVRFLKIMSCNNMSKPLGMGLWEGVPLRKVLWLTKPSANVRRVFYFGHHNGDSKQMFRSSLPIGRVLEDPPGDNPVILCYKLNGQWLTGRRGGPVRMLVPDAYGFKSVKWLKSVLLTNAPAANDTYAGGNNDVDSWMKTMARFVYLPAREKSGVPVAVTGLSQVGVGGLSKAQVLILPRGKEWPADDPYFTKAPWQDAKLLPPPTRWGGDLPGGKLPTDVLFFDKTGRPKQWPLRYTIAHWATLLKGVAPGAYDVYCRTIDLKGIAQPLPRPFKKSGRNAIQKAQLTVEG
jgi:DMSO/TMAO reductase YedYZ molybdopterin-dependent catalytic subunit